MSSEDKKRKRALNFSPREVSHLFNIAVKYRSILENKQTNAVVSSEKNMAWEKITREYNATSSDLNNRSTEQLKRCYDNKKQNLRKKKAQMRQEALKTGGGLPPPSSKLDELDNLVLATMDSLTVEGHHNRFDSDDFCPIPDGTNPAIELVFENSESEKNNILFDKENSDRESYQGSGEFQEVVFIDSENECRSTPQAMPAPKSTFIHLSKDTENGQLPSGSEKSNSNDYLNEELNDTLQIEQQKTTSLEHRDKTDWKNYKTNDLKRPVNPILARHNIGDKSEIQVKGQTARVQGTSQTIRGQARRGPDRRRPSATIVKTMTSSALAEKYELLADKKNIIADYAIKKFKREALHAEEEHRLRTKCLELDIEIRKKQLDKLHC